MKGINFKVIPHIQQRYDTCGDYWMDREGIYQIRVSKMSDWRHVFLVFLHEAFELAWVIKNEVPIEDIDDFDMAFERNRKPDDDSEPGDDAKAPYYQGHQWATILEKISAKVLLVNWEEYDLETKSLEYHV